MNALQVAQEDLPQFPPAQELPLAALPQWIQDLWPTWQQAARVGLGAVDFLANVETWYTDHGRIQQCLSSRIITLGSDPTSWVADILHHDLLIDGVDTQIVAVDPMADDQRLTFAPNCF